MRKFRISEALFNVGLRNGNRNVITPKYLFSDLPPSLSYLNRSFFAVITVPLRYVYKKKKDGTRRRLLLQWRSRVHHYYIARSMSLSKSVKAKKSKQNAINSGTHSVVKRSPGNLFNTIRKCGIEPAFQTTFKSHSSFTFCKRATGLDRYGCARFINLNKVETREKR